MEALSNDNRQQQIPWKKMAFRFIWYKTASGHERTEASLPFGGNTFLRNHQVPNVFIGKECLIACFLYPAPFGIKSRTGTILLSGTSRKTELNEVRKSFVQ